MKSLLIFKTERVESWALCTSVKLVNCELGFRWAGRRELLWWGALQVSCWGGGLSCKAYISTLAFLFSPTVVNLFGEQSSELFMCLAYRERPVIFWLSGVLSTWVGVDSERAGRSLRTGRSGEREGGQLLPFNQSSFGSLPSHFYIPCACLLWAWIFPRFH